ncbi:putative membrane protein [Enterobacter cloacae]|nr:putative membrane protein [Enterobacter cloacae]
MNYLNIFLLVVAANIICFASFTRSQNGIQRTCMIFNI